MRLMLKAALAAVLSFSGCGQVSYGHKAVKTFMPPNRLHLQDSEEISNLNERDFNRILDEVEAFYKPLMKSKFKSNLFIDRKWKDPTVNAYAVQYGSRWEVHMLGGLARRSEITADGFEMVACHELGHHLSGFPLASSWAGNEGQSDYFATLSCARELWKNQLEVNARAVTAVEPYAKNLCDSRWDKQAQRDLCYRTMAAGKSLADLLSSSTAKYETPSRAVVSKTDNQHPEGQCRLDTYVAGALCHASWDNGVIPKTEKLSASYVCLDSRQEVGARPKCWFKPSL